MQYHHVTFSFGHRAKVELLMDQNQLDSIYEMMEHGEKQTQVLGLSQPADNFIPLAYVHVKEEKVITSSVHINPDFIQFTNAIPVDDPVSYLLYSYGEYVKELLAQNKPILIHISYGDFR